MMDHRTLRPEAQPFSWARLLQSQRKVFRQIVGAMKEAVCMLEDTSDGGSGTTTQPGSVNVDPGRTSRILLLSGKRGTGKTSLLLTVQSAVSIPEWFEDNGSEGCLRRRDKSKRSKHDTACTEKDKIKYIDCDDCADDLRCLRDARIIWLETLDMDPLPKPTNLLASILARIDDAMKRGANSGDASGGLLNPLVGEEKALMSLQRLMTDVSLAWDGNIDQRAAQLDPDAYAQEVIRAEKARLSLNRSLRSVLDQLARLAYCRSHRKTVVFVLPVDDFDVNPARCVELLRLLRTIAVPRLFVIALGSIDVAERIFELETAGSLAELGRNELAQDTFKQAGLSSFVREVGVDALRKLVPPKQRLHLDYLTITEALIFHPTFRGLAAARETGGTINGSTIKELLESITFTPDSHGERGRRVPLPVKHLYGLTGSASALLVGPTRRVLDIWFSLAELADETAHQEGTEKKKQIIKTLADWFHEALSEDPNLIDAQIQRFRRTTRIRPDGSVFYNRSAFKIEAEATWFDDVTVRLWNLPGIGGARPNAQFRRHERWVTKLRERQDSDAPEPEPTPLQESMQGQLSDNSQACFELVNDFFCIAMHENAKGHNPIPRPNQARYVTITWDLPNGKRAHVPWVGPVCDTFWEATRFAVAWNSVVAKYDKERMSIDYSKPITDVIGLAWIAAATEFHANPEPEYDWAGHGYDWSKKVEWLRDSEEGRDGKVKEACERLVKETADMLQWIGIDKKKPPVVSWRARGWLWNLAVLLSPESGLPESTEPMPESTKPIRKSIAQMFVDEAKINEFFSKDENASKIRRIRAWLTKDAWEKQDADFQPVMALVHPKIFSGQVERMLKDAKEVIERGASEAPQRSAPRIILPEDIGREASEASHEFPTVDKFLENVDLRNDVVLESLNNTASSPQHRDLRKNLVIAKLCAALWQYGKEHPINNLNNGVLCPQRGDVPESASVEGLWSVEVI